MNPLDELLRAVSVMGECEWHFMDEDDFLDRDNRDVRQGRRVCGKCELCALNDAARRVREWRSGAVLSDDELDPILEEFLGMNMPQGWFDDPHGEGENPRCCAFRRKLDKLARAVERAVLDKALVGRDDDPIGGSERRSERSDERKSSPSSPKREGLPASVSDDRDGTATSPANHSYFSRSRGLDESAESGLMEEDEQYAAMTAARAAKEKP